VIGLGHYLALSGVLFLIGAAGFAARRNLVVALMSIEIMLNAVNLAFVAGNRFRPENHAGQVIAFFTIAIAAAEAAVGLAIVVSVYRLKKTIRTDEADQMRG